MSDQEPLRHTPHSGDSLTKPRGILKNAPIQATYKTEDINKTDEEILSEFDRKKVIENTKRNAEQFSKISSDLLLNNKTEGDKIRAKIAEQKKKMYELEVLNEKKLNQNKENRNSKSNNSNGDGDELDEDHLKWNEANLYLNEQEKSATMKIDEPKTPYEGGFNPNNEYYKEDDEGEEEGDGLGEFSLGEGAADIPLDDVAKRHLQSLNGGEIIESDEQPQEEEKPEEEAHEEGEEEEEELSPEEKHKLFEQKRKQHYHLKAEVLKHPIKDDDVDDDGDSVADK
ncbi:hypothetical protein BVG19_g3153 [[Candida] boidinii]|nr:hypothetical protein BVG19_g3153 [[Candida] boidinii]OWB52436.1 hypothetical protein B5S27_g4011 [[Candida] boidinii]